VNFSEKNVKILLIFEGDNIKEFINSKKVCELNYTDYIKSFAGLGTS
jgi:hypothetical protein